MVSVRICAWAARGMQVAMITIAAQASLLGAAFGFIGFENFTSVLGRNEEVRASDRERFHGLSAVAGCLQFEHLCVATANFEKLFVTTLFGNTSIFENEDSICHLNS